MIREVAFPVKKKLNIFFLGILVIGIVSVVIIIISFKRLSVIIREKRLNKRRHMRGRRRSSGRVNHDYNVQNGELHSIFWSIRLILIITLVTGIPFLVFAFSESVKGIAIIYSIYLVIDFISKRYGWDKLGDYD